MTKDKALKRALELAQEGVEIHSPNAPEYKVCAALIALAQPEEKYQYGTSLLNAMMDKEHKTGEYIPMPKNWSGVDFDIKTMPPERKPLSWEKVLEIGLECANDHSRLPYEVKIARAVEAAHGIKEQK